MESKNIISNTVNKPYSKLSSVEKYAVSYHYSYS